MGSAAAKLRMARAIAEVETRMLEAVRRGWLGVELSSRFVAEIGDVWLDGNVLKNRPIWLLANSAEESCSRWMLKKAAEGDACC